MIAFHVRPARSPRWVRFQAWWLRVTGRRWDHYLLRDAARRRARDHEGATQ